MSVHFAVSPRTSCGFTMYGYGWTVDESHSEVFGAPPSNYVHTTVASSVTCEACKATEEYKKALMDESAD